MFTVLFGISLCWLRPDSPLTASFLTERQRYIVIHQLSSNTTEEYAYEERSGYGGVVGWADLAVGFCYFAHNMTNAFADDFYGIIIKGFGYSTLSGCVA
jgi:hypothetical protein